jgi:hypothetical protein
MVRAAVQSDAGFGGEDPARSANRRWARARDAFDDRRGLRRRPKGALRGHPFDSEITLPGK